MQRRDRNEAGKLFIGGLSWNTDQDTLLNYFSQYGEVCDCVVMKNQQTGKSRGFGFVTFKDPNCVDTVLSVNVHTIDGRNVDAKACNPKGMNKSAAPSRDGPGGGGGGRGRGGPDPDKNKKIFIGGLPNVDEEVLKEAFSEYGPVRDVTIMFDQVQKKSRGFGFLTFENEDCVEKAVNDHYVIVHGKKVECKRAEPRDGKGDRGPGGPRGPMMDNGMNMPPQQEGGDWPGNGWNMPPGGGPPRGPYQEQFQQGPGGYGGPGGFQPPQQQNQPQGFNQGGYNPQGYGQQPGGPPGGPPGPPQPPGPGYGQQAWNQQPDGAPGQQGVWPPPPAQPSTSQGPPPPAQPVPAQAPQPLTNPVGGKKMDIGGRTPEDPYSYGGQPQQGYNQPGTPSSYGAQWGGVPPANQAQTPAVPQPPAAQPGYAAYGQPPAAPAGAPYGTPGQPPTPQSPQTAAPPRPYGDYSAGQPAAPPAPAATPAYAGYSPYGTPQAPAGVPDPYGQPAPTGVPAQPGAAPGYGATPPAAPPTDPVAAQPKPADYGAYSYGAYGDATAGFAGVPPPAGAYPGQGEAGQPAYGAPPGAGGYQRAAGAQGYHPYRR